MDVTPGSLVAWLRAAGEPSRLRLLMLCQEAAVSVSDLAQALGQSEPRVSRHLRILCEAGLLERLPQGQWVHYRLAQSPAAAGFVRGLLAQLDRRDPQFLADRAAARAAGASASGTSGGESRLGRALAGFFDTHRPAHSAQAVLVIGGTHPELLEAAARSARSCTVQVSSRRAAQACRAFAARRGFHCEIRQTAGLSPQTLEPAAAFDAVLLDCPLAAAALAGQLQAARGALTAHGRVWVFEPYEALEAPRGRVVEHPLARLRRLLSEAQLACERLGPIESDGEHVLAAVAAAVVTRSSGAGAAAGVGP
ncbi:MAG TPA: metalloregulator ArsR/SmtB family transcription factor [Steroidobacteraceae bacterium]|jgi:DNA-binding transcriptional ArsR family regulator/16S rRNA G966 N2-methylase RsmD|nr:metalloregulator ArsR/SmtB family transcription factor [Steroidobacteraceae bacterium]